MDKQIKAEVIILYVSQAVALLAAAYCAWVSSRVEAVLFSGRTAIVWNILLAVVIIANLRIARHDLKHFSELSFRLFYDSIPTLSFSTDMKIKEGKITEAEATNFRRKIRKILDWAGVFDSAASPFFFIDLMVMLEVTGFAITKSIAENRICFSSMHCLAALLVSVQTLWLYILSSHIFISLYFWIDRKYLWYKEHDSKGNHEKNN